MTDESDEDDVNHSQCRPFLRRSQTITVSGIDNQYPELDCDQDGVRKEVHCGEPKSSCQALRHAVSSLSRIDDFHLEDLGGGFFANVYKATHKTTNEEMVMKINKYADNRQNALMEVQLLNKMSHPNVLRFLGVCVHEGQLHPLTEYIPGGNLENLLADKSEELPWIFRIKLSLDIAKGLSYVHGAGFIHRDLTSKNVLVKKGENKKYTAVIADFGLAARIPDPDATTPLRPVGSPFWIAPEVLHGKFYKETADLFSFGIINMEISTRIENDPDVMPRTENFGVDYHKICELVDYCPLDFLLLAFKCCQVQPERRPSAKSVVSNLEKVYNSLISGSSGSPGRGHKRSKSEDNILQCNDSFSDDSIFMTAESIAQAMSADDPDYSPSEVNPFAGISQLRYGHKLMGFHSRKVSISSPFHKNVGETDTPVLVYPEIYKQEALSLPSSPVMLRKAAEQMHQVSLRGENAVKIETKRDLLLRFISDESSESSKECSTTAADRQLQFRNNRTRSLGCLDFFGHGKKQAKTHTLQLSNHSEQTRLCNRNDILKESSCENILDGDATDFNSEYDDRTNISEDWDYNQGNCASLASESYKTAFSYRETRGDNTDTSDISLSSCSASSFDSVPDMENITHSFSSDKKIPDNISIEEKTLIAIQNDSNDSDYFGKSVITSNT